MDLVAEWAKSIHPTDSGLASQARNCLRELLGVDAMLRVDINDLQDKLAWGSLGIGLHNVELFPLRFVQAWAIPPWLGHSQIALKLKEMRGQRERIAELIGDLIEAKIETNQTELLLLQAKSFLDAYQIYVPGWCRQWPRYAFWGLGAWFSIKLLIQIDLRTMLLNLWEASGNFVRDRLILPLQDIWHTIRYRDGAMALNRTVALQADLASLERMIGEFVRDQGQVGVVEDPLDMSFLMTRYEQDIRHPIKSALWGNLIRLILIQIQKTKVEAEMAMTALDRLLQANELNFELLAILPIMALLLGAGRLISESWRRWRNLPSQQLRESLRIHYWQLSRCLDEGEVSLGRLFVHCARLLAEAEVPADERNRLLADVLLLIRPQMSLEDRRWILLRIMPHK